MNLHEECLLKYLLNPMDLTKSTELLKLNNLVIEKGLREYAGSGFEVWHSEDVVHYDLKRS